MGEEDAGMSRHRHPNDESRVRASAQRRVVAVFACLNILCPTADRGTRRQLANKILTLVHGNDPSILPRKTITPAMVYEMITRNSQCVLNQTGRCPLLVFSQQLCEELNEFFKEDR
jgi:hypothetical protein